MFTGIITDIGKIENIVKGKKTIRLTIKTKYQTSKIAIGASVSCNGCCLTVVKRNKNSLEFDLSPETLEKTNLVNAKKGDLINLEQALKMGDELGGHIVSGHADCLAEVISVKEIDKNWVIKFKLPLTYKKYIAPKGSVTINGVSLTVNDVKDNIFGINIIPHTLDNTNLRLLKKASKVNIEIDLLARYLEKLIKK